MKKLAIFAAVMVIGAGVAVAATLEVPFFRDRPTGAIKTRAFIGVKEASGMDQTITVIYTATNASNVPEDQKVTFLLLSNRSISWAPVESSSTEFDGHIVPNMSIIGPNGTTLNFAGSAKIISIKPNGIAGRYQEIDDTNGSVFAHVLLSG